MAIKMIGLDLDGTVLKNDKTISDRTRYALEEAASRGVIIVPDTGRPLSGVPENIMKLKGLRYVISSNGSAVQDLDSCSRILEASMPFESCRRMLGKYADREIPREVFIGGYGYEEEHSMELMLERLRNKALLPYYRMSRRIVDDLDDFLLGFTSDKDEKRRYETGSQSGVDSIAMMLSTADERSEIINDFEKDVTSGDFEVIPVKGWDIEICSPLAGKGRMLKRLGVELGISDDEIMAVGDGGNDVCFAGSIPFTVAMGNSSESMLEAASYVTGDNAHDGVAEVIEKFVL